MFLRGSSTTSAWFWVGTLTARAVAITLQSQRPIRPATQSGEADGSNGIVSMLQRIDERLQNLEEKVGLAPSSDREYGSRVPTRMDEHGGFHDLTLFERLRYLERKFDGSTNWLKDPQLFSEREYACANVSNVQSDHQVCFDKWEENLARRRQQSGTEGCVVYDLGIRANPEFGVGMMKEFGCSVRAYDPSPTSMEWWANSTEAAQLKADWDGKYKFMNVGAGGVDGPLELYSYNWQQVSIYKAENDHTLRPAGAPDEPPVPFKLPVQTLPTMMRENKDRYIDVVKVDIEGSEYMFFQDMFDRMGCPPVGQFAVEWHHFSVDSRYGSSPELNALHNLLNTCGYKAFYNRDHWRDDPRWTQGGRKLPPMRYTLTSYCKDCV